VAAVTMGTQVPTWTLQGGASRPAAGPMGIPVTLNLVIKQPPLAVTNPPTTSVSGGGAGAAAAISSLTALESYTGGEDQ